MWMMYLLVTAALAAILWRLIGPDVKRVIYETYINPP
jgi:hypothetical protein